MPGLKMIYSIFAVLGLFLNTVLATAQAYKQLEFSNVGFTGSFTPVQKISDETSSKCTCEPGDREYFSGTNAPLSEYLSVHLRGPLKLTQFAFYVADKFIINDNSSNSGTWDRVAYYNAEKQTADNVTFTTNAGTDSPCLGKALCYAADDGVSKADSSTVLKSDNYISSDEEFSIFSSTECPKSGKNKKCGVYRKGIPAYYGFYGTTKMFLFEFEMPRETKKNSSSFSYYDLPAIWLLNDHIPRTSQYPTNGNCSCWSSGCGEYDIFEVMNGTERDRLYSTFHTFQGIENLNVGIQSYGYIERDTENTMRGGVIFDSNGSTISFISSSLSFDQNLTASSVNGLLYVADEDQVYDRKLLSVAGSATSSKQSDAFSLLTDGRGLWYYLLTIFTGLAHFIMV